MLLVVQFNRCRPYTPLQTVKLLLMIVHGNKIYGRCPGLHSSADPVQTSDSVIMLISRNTDNLLTFIHQRVESKIQEILENEHNLLEFACTVVGLYHVGHWDGGTTYLLVMKALPKSVMLM